MDPGKTSSILKSSRVNNITAFDNDEEQESPEPTLGPHRMSMRRVSFAVSNHVKEFAADPENQTIWNSTYEEAIDKSDSTPSLQNSLCRATQNMNLECSSDSPNILRNDTEKTINFTCGGESIILDTTLLNLDHVLLEENKENESPRSELNSNMDFTRFVPLHDHVTDNMQSKTMLNQSMDLTLHNPRPVLSTVSTNKTVYYDNMEFDSTSTSNTDELSMRGTFEGEKSMELTLPIESKIKTIVEFNNMELTMFLPKDKNLNPIVAQNTIDKENDPQLLSVIASNLENTQASESKIEGDSTKNPRFKIKIGKRLDANPNVTDISMANFKKCASSTIVESILLQGNERDCSITVRNRKRKQEFQMSQDNVILKQVKVKQTVETCSIIESRLDTTTQKHTDSSGLNPASTSIYLPEVYNKMAYRSENDSVSYANNTMSHCVDPFDQSSNRFAAVDPLANSTVNATSVEGSFGKNVTNVSRLIPDNAKNISVSNFIRFTPYKDNTGFNLENTETERSGFCFVGDSVMSGRADPLSNTTVNQNVGVSCVTLEDSNMVACLETLAEEDSKDNEAAFTTAPLTTTTVRDCSQNRQGLLNTSESNSLRVKCINDDHQNDTTKVDKDIGHSFKVQEDKVGATQDTNIQIKLEADMKPTTDTDIPQVVVSAAVNTIDDLHSTTEMNLCISSTLEASTIRIDSIIEKSTNIEVKKVSVSSKSTKVESVGDRTTVQEKSVSNVQVPLTEHEADRSLQTIEMNTCAAKTVLNKSVLKENQLLKNQMSVTPTPTEFITNAANTSNSAFKHDSNITNNTVSECTKVEDNQSLKWQMSVASSANASHSFATRHEAEVDVPQMNTSVSANITNKTVYGNDLYNVGGYSKIEETPSVLKTSMTSHGASNYPPTTDVRIKIPTKANESIHNNNIKSVGGCTKTQENQAYDLQTQKVTSGTRNDKSSLSATSVLRPKVEFNSSVNVGTCEGEINNKTEGSNINEQSTVPQNQHLTMQVNLSKDAVQDNVQTTINNSVLDSNCLPPSVANDLSRKEIKQASYKDDDSVHNNDLNLCNESSLQQFVIQKCDVTDSRRKNVTSKVLEHKSHSEKTVAPQTTQQSPKKLQLKFENTFDTSIKSGFEMSKENSFANFLPFTSTAISKTLLNADMSDIEEDVNSTQSKQGAVEAKSNDAENLDVFEGIAALSQQANKTQFLARESLQPLNVFSLSSNVFPMAVPEELKVSQNVSVAMSVDNSGIKQVNTEQSALASNLHLTGIEDSYVQLENNTNVSGCPNMFLQSNLHESRILNMSRYREVPVEPNPVDSSPLSNVATGLNVSGVRPLNITYRRISKTPNITSKPLHISNLDVDPLLDLSCSPTEFIGKAVEPMALSTVKLDTTKYPKLCTDSIVLTNKSSTAMEVDSPKTNTTGNIKNNTYTIKSQDENDVKLSLKNRTYTKETEGDGGSVTFIKKAETNSPTNLVKNCTYTKETEDVLSKSFVKNRTYTKQSKGESHAKSKNCTYTNETELVVKSPTYTKETDDAETTLIIKNRTYTKEADMNVDTEFSQYDIPEVPQCPNLSLFKPGYTFNISCNTPKSIAQYDPIPMQTFDAYNHASNVKKCPPTLSTLKRSVTPYHTNFICMSPGMDDTQHLINLDLSKEKYKEHPRSDFSKIIAGETPTCMSPRFMPLKDFSSNVFPISLENTREHSINEHQLQHDIKRLTGSYCAEEQANISAESLELCGSINDTYTPAAQYAAGTSTADDALSIKLQQFQESMRETYDKMDENNKHFNNTLTQLNQIVRRKVIALENLSAEPPMIHDSSSFDIDLDGTMENIEPQPAANDVINMEPERIVTVEEEIAESINQKGRSLRFWEIIDIESGVLYLSALHDSVEFSIEYNEETKIVNAVDKTYKLLDTSHPHGIFVLELFKKSISTVSIGSALGEQFNILSLIDYLHMCLSKMFDVLKQFVRLEREFSLKISKDLQTASFKIWNSEKLSVWCIAMNVSDLNNMTADCVSVTAELGTVNEAAVKSLVTDCTKGVLFFYDFTHKLQRLSSI